MWDEGIDLHNAALRRAEDLIYADAQVEPSAQRLQPRTLDLYYSVLAWRDEEHGYTCKLAHALPLRWHARTLD